MLCEPLSLPVTSLTSLSSNFVPVLQSMHSLVYCVQLDMTLYAKHSLVYCVHLDLTCMPSALLCIVLVYNQQSFVAELEDAAAWQE